MNQPSVTLLIVDDSPEDRAVCRRCLQQDSLYHYTILEFATAEESLEWCRHTIPDVILLDWMLPDLDGLACLEAIRLQLNQTQTTVVILTGYQEIEIAVQAMKSGAQDFLAKDRLTPELLQRTIHNLLAQRDLARQLEQSQETQRLMAAIALRIRQSLQLSEILDTTATEVRQVLKADRVLVYQFHADLSGTIVAESVLPEWPITLGQQIEDTCFQQGGGTEYLQGKKQAIADVRQAGLSECHLQLLQRFSVKANLVVPILVNNGLWGLLIAHQCNAPRRWQPAELDLLDQLAVQIAIAIQQASTYHKIQAELVERQQVEAELQESQAQLKAFLDNSPLPTWIADSNGRTLYLSQTYFQTFQPQLGTERDWHGTTPFDLYPEELAQQYQENFRRVAETQQLLKSIEKAPRRDGSLGDFLVYQFPLRGIAGETLIGGSAADITEQLRAEQALQQLNQELEARIIQRTTALQASEQQLLTLNALQQAILNSSDYSIISTTSEGTIQTFNAAAQRMLGYMPEEVVGQFRPDQIFHDPQELQQRAVLLSAELNQTITPDFEVFAVKPRMGIPTEEEWTYIRKDGSRFPVLLSVTALHDASGQLMGFLGIAKDITQQKRMEAVLREKNERLAFANAELARATRLKDEFLANMSHELRTPLNAILGLSEVLQEGVWGELNDSQKRSLATIESSGRHLLELINDILDLSKIEAGRLELSISNVSIATLCEDSLTFVRQLALQKGIQLTLKLPASIGKIQADSLRLRQILINLLSNAIKFTAEGGWVHLEVSLQTMTVEHPSVTQSFPDWVIFAIRDNGIGIAPDKLSTLFQPFVQIDSQLNRQYAGTGLGLVLVRRIAELHGGSVAVESEPGRGSCFTVRIPAVAPVEVESLSTSATPTSSLSPPAAADATQGPLILLVEDNETNVETVFAYLESYGFRLLVARDGIEAIALTQAYAPDLILMDIQMPKMDGLEATRRIRNDLGQTEVPIIALTALAMAGDRERCLAAGANEYLAKPVRLKQLVETIQRLLVKQSQSSSC